MDGLDDTTTSEAEYSIISMNRKKTYLSLYYNQSKSHLFVNGVNFY